MRVFDTSSLLTDLISGRMPAEQCARTLGGQVNDIQRYEGSGSGLAALTDDQRGLLRRMLTHSGPELNDQELETVLAKCKAMGLDPWSKQLYVNRRRSKIDGNWVNISTVEATIDGLRAIAHRHGLAGMDETVYRYDNNNQLVSATVTVYKMIEGQRVSFPGSARFDEYAQKTRDGELTHMWRDKSHTMLEKCAEAKALRRACPVMGSVYVPEEMMAQEGGDYMEAEVIVQQPEPQEVSTSKPVSAGSKEKKLREQCYELLKEYNHAYKVKYNFKAALSHLCGREADRLSAEDYSELYQSLTKALAETKAEA